MQCRPQFLDFDLLMVQKLLDDSSVLIRKFFPDLPIDLFLQDRIKLFENLLL